MTEWQELALGETIDLVIDYRGKTPKKLGGDWSSSGYRALSAKNIKTGNIVQPESIRYVNEELYKKWMKDEVKKGDILITSEAPYGQIYFWDSEEKIVLSQRLYDIRVSDSYDKTFVYYYMLTNEFQKELDGRATGTTVMGLRQPELLKCKIRCPQYNIQQKIGSILKAIDDKIVVNNQINKNLEEQAQALFKAWFVDFEPFGGVMPNDWQIGKLSKVVEFINGYAFKSKELLDAPENNCYQVFKQGHINRGGGFNAEGTKSWYQKSLATKLTKYILHKGDILMAMTDMKDNVAILGNTALMEVDDEYIVNQRVGLLRCNGYKNISYGYIYLLTNNADFLGNLRKRANSGVQVNLSSMQIKSSETIIPNAEVNIAFSNIVEPLFEVIANNNKENKRLRILRDALLPKLMSGELDVSKIEF